MADSRRFSGYMPLAQGTQQPPNADEQIALNSLQPLLSDEFQLTCSSKWIRGYLQQENFAPSQGLYEEIAEMVTILDNSRNTILDAAPGEASQVHWSDTLGTGIYNCYYIRDVLLSNLDEVKTFLYGALRIQQDALHLNLDRDMQSSLAAIIQYHADRFTHVEKDIHNVIKMDMPVKDFDAYYYEHLLNILLGIEARVEKFWKAFLDFHQTWC